VKLCKTNVNILDTPLSYFSIIYTSNVRVHIINNAAFYCTTCADNPTDVRKFVNESKFRRGSSRVSVCNEHRQWKNEAN